MDRGIFQTSFIGDNVTQAKGGISSFVAWSKFA
jgi:hypothetical protein